MTAESGTSDSASGPDGAHSDDLHAGSGGGGLEAFVIGQVEQFVSGKEMLYALQFRRRQRSFKDIRLLRGLALEMVLPIVAHQHADVFVRVGVDETHQVRGRGRAVLRAQRGHECHGHEKKKPQPTLAHDGRILARQGREGYGF